MKQSLKISFVLGIISAIAFLIALPYTIPLTTASLPAEAVPSTSFMAITGAIQFLIFGFVFSLIGLSIADKVGLNLDWIRSVILKTPRPNWDKKAVGYAVGWGVLGSIILFVGIQYYFAARLPVIGTPPEWPWWAGLTTIFQGGIVEELIMRLGVMTLVVWLLAKWFAKNRPIPGWIYIIGILFATLAFGIGHLPAAHQLYGEITPIIAIYILFGNSLLGLGLGALYWKKGLEYAIISHMTADFTLHFVFANLMR